MNIKVKVKNCVLQKFDSNKKHLKGEEDWFINVVPIDNKEQNIIHKTLGTWLVGKFKIGVEGVFDSDLWKFIPDHK